MGWWIVLDLCYETSSRYESKDDLDVVNDMEQRCIGA